MLKKELPVLNEKNILPTGKFHTSYSETSDWLDCSFRHKLKHIDKINLDKPSIHTEFGTAIHDALEEYLISRRPMAEEVFEAVKLDFHSKMLKLKELDPSLYVEKDIEEFSREIAPILAEVPEWMDSTFPGWEPIAAEYNLFEEIENQQQKYFKGFIDCVIRVPLKKRKKSHVQNPMRLSELTGEAQDEQEYQTVIIDWKTTSFGWTADKKRDFQKHLQLALYKHFWCKIFNVDLKSVKVGFVFLKRTPKKGGSRCEFLPISVGPKTEQKAKDILQNMLNQMQQRRFVKNRNSCRFCPYLNTEHCR